ncbi:MAG: TetR/AcrR family transcriptional regulator [Solirubrobacterales bacterium]
MSSSRQAPEPTPRRRPRRAEVRQRLLDAAGEAFAALGYDASSIDEIARRAGLTKGAVYSNFESKEALFFALLGEQVTARIALVEGLRPAEQPAAEGIRAIGDALMAAVADDPEWQLLFIEFWQRSIRDPEARERFVPQRRRLRRLISDAIRLRSEEIGLALPLPPEQLATVVLSLSNGLAIEYLLDPESVPRELFGDVLTALASRA